MDEPSSGAGEGKAGSVKPHPGDCVEFRLSREEPGIDFLWTAGAVVVATFLALFKGAAIGGIFLAVMLGFLIFAYFATLHDEETAQRDRSVHLRFDPSGISIPLAMNGLAPWQEIENITFSHHKGSTTMHIVFVKGSPYAPPQTATQRFLWGAGVASNITALEGDWEQVAAAVRRYAPPRIGAVL